MANKVVRFSSDDELYSCPNTPSPTFSTSSLSYSPILITPPSLEQALPPISDGCGISSVDEELIDGSLIIHPYLAVPPRNRMPYFTYDLMRNPILKGAVNPALPQRVMSEPATTPPVRRLSLVCKRLPWTIDIFPLTLDDHSYVTVGDAIHGIYSSLRSTVNPHEISAELPSRQAQIMVAFSRRCERLRQKEGVKYESQSGVKRIDFLDKSHNFIGIAFGNEEGIWKLLVED